MIITLSRLKLSCTSEAENARSNSCFRLIHPSETIMLVIVVPILAPIAAHFQIDLLWFAVLIAMNLQTSFLTPPFGFSLFYLKAAAPPEIRMHQIYTGILPFVLIQIAALAVILAFPEVTLWLPDLMDKLRLQ